MSTVVAENRSPVFVPLTLAALILILSGAFVLIGVATTPADARDTLSPAAQALQWLCSTSLLVGFVLALSARLVEKNGVPRRAWLTVLAALVLIFGLGLAWSLGQNQALTALAASRTRQELLMWVSLLGAAKVVLIGAIALPLAWRLGGRAPAPAVWKPWQRRVLGALIAASLCAGIALLVQNVAASFTALGDGDQRVGMSVVALGVGTVHGLFALMFAARRGSGAVPASLSSLLTPALIVLASLPAVRGGEGWDMAGRIAVVLLILLFAPMVSWLLVRWLHGRIGREAAAR
ncbi:hypothetical protein [Pseudomonas sp. CGJS7]|uniref:hypothetical protein n=1 Tax=Pseudomonas sp. CGJS7 TaxID=3109348 RepID=UPI00300B4587